MSRSAKVLKTESGEYRLLLYYGDKLDVWNPKCTNYSTLDAAKKEADEFVKPLPKAKVVYEVTQKT